MKMLERKAKTHSDSWRDMDKRLWLMERRYALEHMEARVARGDDDPSAAELLRADVLGEIVKMRQKAQSMEKTWDKT